MARFVKFQFNRNEVTTLAVKSISNIQIAPPKYVPEGFVAENVSQVTIYTGGVQFANFRVSKDLATTLEGWVTKQYDQTPLGDATKLLKVFTISGSDLI